MRWGDIDTEIGRAVEAQTRRVLETYAVEPGRVEEDANLERSAAEGAYAKRQIFELLQNAADALREAPGRAEVLLTRDRLYVANQGAPLTVQGVESLMATHRSGKRDDQIGRFGLGFKSVLAVSDSPRIYSRSGSFGFDRSRARETIAAVVPNLAHYPVTRTAVVLDAVADSGKDPALASLMKWATTVVCVPLIGGREDIARSLKDFPAEFALFSPQVKQLDLEDRETGGARRITVASAADGDLLLDNSGRKSRWTLASVNHTPSKAALDDGGYQAAREVLTVHWAVPLEGALVALGAFWAFFPTSDGTTLSGIVNAPWKLTDDRATLLEGAFNRELLTEVLPRLVVETLPKLAPEKRPTLVLDVLPARGKEARNAADDIINEPVMRAVAHVRCIPTLAGDLGFPRTVRLHPEGLDSEDLELWASACPDPEKWVSHSVMSKEHRSKVSRLLAYRERSAESLGDWIRYIVRHVDERRQVEASAVAVRLVAQLIRKHPDWREELLRAPVLLLEDGTFHTVRKGQVFVRGGSDSAGHFYIDPVLASSPGVKEALDYLGIEVMDTVGELRSELSQRPIRWESVWPSSRRLSISDAEAVFRDVFGDTLLEALRVRTYAGEWKSLGQAYLGGDIVPRDGHRDGGRLIDPRFHGQDQELLGRLGAVDAPTKEADPPTEPWRSAKEGDLRDEYRKKAQGTRLLDSQIVVDVGRLPWPVQPLQDMSPEGRAALTKSLLAQLDPSEGWPLSRLGGAGKRIQFRNPIWRFIGQHGYVDTPLGLQPLTRCVEYDEDLAAIDGIAQPLPLAPPWIGADAARALHLKKDLDGLSTSDWTALLEEAGRLAPEERVLLYGWAADRSTVVPERIKAARGRGHAWVTPREAAITASKEVYRSLLEADIPVLLATEDDAELLHEEWQLVRGEDMLDETLDPVPDGEPVLVVEAFPPLKNYLELDQHDLRLQLCKSIELRTSTPTGQRTRNLASATEARTVYTTARSEKDVVGQVISELGLRVTPAKVLRLMEESRKSKLRRDVAAEPDIVAKLLLAIGTEPLLERLPAPAIEALRAHLGRDLADEEIVRLAVAAEGYGILQAHTRALEKNGLEPPTRWGASRGARDWVTALNFPIEYAGFSGEVRPSEVEVEGPPRLPALHDYQTEIAVRIRGLLDPQQEENRGLVPLPTGAGKTRVAAQAIIEHMLDQQTGFRLCWLAETEELCEQAVQTWSYLWRALGDPDRPLNVSRLWGSNQVNERDGFHLVVASLQKLSAVIDDRTEYWQEGYAWLGRQDLVVVDEAHRSIAPSYTRAISRLGGAERVASMDTPLLGLTATPFRGFNERETTTLATRYHNNLLDTGVFHGDPYTALQEMNVLARVKQIELPGSEITLNPEELDQTEKMRTLPASFERRLGNDAHRNNQILQSLLELDDDASVLLFATSVDNARVLASLLSFHGISARAIAGDTDRFARRRYVEDFRNKKIRVLTNYNVFTEGFDVPRVDAVYVTRPTYSPNVYQQMIGRGLRGRLNGGNDEVLIVNVADNVTNYADVFAFRHFEHLWGARTDA